MKERFTEKQKKRLGVAVVFLAVLITLGAMYFFGRPLLRFASQPEEFRLWVEARGFWGQLAYMGMVIFQVLLALIPGEPLEIVGGYAFGALEGTILCLLASTLGSLLVFFLVRQFGVHIVEIFYPREKLQRLRFLKSSPKRNLLFLVIFTLPGTPKDLLCYFAGLTDMKPGLWLLICSLGRIPSILTSTLGGGALGSERYGFAVLLFAATLAVSAGGLVLYHYICKKHEETRG